MKTMNRYSRVSLVLGFTTTILLITALDTVLRPGDSAKGWILAAGIWAYLLFFWRPWRKPPSDHEPPRSTRSG
jgi:hypothetical protein